MNIAAITLINKVALTSLFWKNNIQHASCSGTYLLRVTR